MEFQSIAAIVFLILLGGFLFLQRKKIQVQKILFPFLYVVLYRTKLGLRQMDSWARRFPRLLNWFGNVSIALGFLGMATICVMLVYGLYQLFSAPTAAAGVSLVLPFKAKGVFYVPFFYWILTIFVVAVLHEFCHGVMARVHGIPVKFSGFAFLAVLIPILPAAFVEPDEKKMAKKSTRAQLSVFAAGPVSNLLTAGLVILAMIAVVNPVLGILFTPNGVQIDHFANTTTGEKYPAELAGIHAGDRIIAIDDKPIISVKDFTALLATKKAGDAVRVQTNRSAYVVALAANPDDDSKPYLGVFVAQATERNSSILANYGALPFTLAAWISGFFFWLYALSLGIGLFNLLPLGPIDGGRMWKTALEHFFPAEQALRYWSWTSMFFLALILLNLGIGFFR